METKEYPWIRPPLLGMIMDTGLQPRFIKLHSIIIRFLSSLEVWVCMRLIHTYVHHLDAPSSIPALV